MTETPEHILYSTFMEHARRYVTEAGKILATYQDNVTVVAMKDSVDLATNADIAAEKYILDAIRRDFPGHGIYSEEAGVFDTNAEYTWVVDPLDGTKEYARGLREYNCLVAIERKGELVACAAARNGVNDLYSAALGNGATVNSRPIHVSNQSDIAKSFVGFHVPVASQPEELITAEMRAMDAIVRTVYRLRPGWDDAEYCGWVARGVLDGHIVSADVNKWYDIAPGILLVLEAGGRVTDWDGNPIQNRRLSGGVVLSNGHLHTRLLEITKHFTQKKT